MMTKQKQLLAKFVQRNLTLHLSIGAIKIITILCTFEEGNDTFLYKMLYSYVLIMK